MGTSFPAVIRSVWGWRSLLVLLTEKRVFKNLQVGNTLKGLESVYSAKLLKGMIFILSHNFPALMPLLVGLKPGGLQANKLIGPGSLEFHPNKKSIQYEFPSLGPGVIKPRVPVLGRLVALREAAGKIRIIAIVDAITQ